MGTLFTDFSMWSLVATNLVVIGVAHTNGWSLGDMLWVYWSQSVAIGIVTFIRILSLKNYSSEGVEVNGHPVEPTKGLKLYTAFFFLIHYGLFHSAYFFFLNERTPFSATYSTHEIKIFSLTAILFLINHLFSFVYNSRQDTINNVQLNIGTVMAYPYARILPMHLIIIFGSVWGGASILFFLLLKTVSDVLMHLIEHHRFRTINALNP